VSEEDKKPEKKGYFEDGENVAGVISMILGIIFLIWLLSNY
jgi:hypothetical protein